MSKHILLPALIVALSLATGATAYCAAVVFGGTAGPTQLSAWGNGAIKLDTANKLSGSPSLAVDTRGYAEGGRLALGSPVALAPYLAAAPSSFVVVKVKISAAAAPARGGVAIPGAGGGFNAPPAMPGLPAAGGGLPGMPGMPRGDAGDLLGKDRWAQVPGLPGMPGGGGGMPGMPGGGGAMPGGGMPGGGMPGMGGGGMPGMGMPGMGGGGMMAPGAGGGMPGLGGFGGFGMGGAAPKAPKPLQSVRVVLVTDKGQLDLGAFAVDSLKKEGDWREIRVAFKDLKFAADQKPTQLQAVVLTGNSVGTFNVGRVELVGG